VEEVFCSPTSTSVLVLGRVDGEWRCGYVCITKEYDFELCINCFLEAWSNVKKKKKAWY
jgi:hypothetical protein